MIKKANVKKSSSFFISLLLIFLLFFNLLPTTQSVQVFPGSPNEDYVDVGTMIIFNNVRLTIRSDERIPINHLTFKIMDDNVQASYVRFEMDGSLLEQDPSDTFTVTRLFDLSSVPYGSGGSYQATDELEGTTQYYDYGYGHGYGYGYSSYTDTVLTYRITYKTHQSGTFNAKLFVNSDTHTYKSEESTSFTVSSEPAPSDVIYVDDDAEPAWYNGNHVSTIQSAVFIANEGGEIIINQGTYNGKITIEKPLTLTGADPQITFIDRQYNDFALEIKSDNVDLSKLSIEGIYFDNAQYCNIDHCIIANATNGLLFDEGANNIITDNTFNDNGNAVTLIRTGNNVVKNSEFYDNTIALKLTQSSNHIIQSNYFARSTNGMLLEISTNNEIKQNNFANNQNGINMYDSSDNLINNNLIEFNTNGIYIRESSDNLVTDNTISNNNEKGIFIRTSSDNTITDNHILENKYGAYCESSHHNYIFNNYFNNTNNAWDDDINYWNISIVTEGTNIIGGPYLAGNFWNDYTGQDTDGDGLGDNNIPYTSNGAIQDTGDYHPLSYANINLAPKKPQRPLGPTSGRADKQYTYSTSTTDPEGDRVYYKWEYKEGVTTSWIGPYDSGENCVQVFKWGNEGTYNIRVKSKDIHGDESPWSDPLIVSMPKGKDYSSPLGRLIERIIELFPMLEKILNFIYDFITTITNI